MEKGFSKIDLIMIIGVVIAIMIFGFALMQGKKYSNQKAKEKEYIRTEIWRKRELQHQLLN